MAIQCINHCQVHVLQKGLQTLLWLFSLYFLKDLTGATVLTPTVWLHAREPSGSTVNL